MVCIQKTNYVPVVPALCGMSRPLPLPMTLPKFDIAPPVVQNNDVKVGVFLDANSGAVYLAIPTKKPTIGIRPPTLEETEPKRKKRKLRPKMVEESYDMDLLRKNSKMLVLAALTVEALTD